MLTRFKVSNFQSLYDIELNLEKLTVIVGKSSSGKSAVIRALLTVCNNSRGTPYVSHGQAHSTLELSLTDQSNKAHVVTLERGPTKGTYALVSGNEEGELHSKLGGTTPDAVRAVLGLPEGATDLQIGGQFDKPFLLDETGASVARTFGDLTNVSTLFEAARESNRRKLEFSSKLKVRESDFSSILAQVQDFKTLPAKIAALSAIEFDFRQIQIKQFQLDNLNLNLAEIAVLEEKLADFDQKTLELPDFEPVLQVYGALTSFNNLWTEVLIRGKALKAANLARNNAEDEFVVLENQLQSLWNEMKICPTCGREMHK